MQKGKTNMKIMQKMLRDVRGVLLRLGAGACLLLAAGGVQAEPSVTINEVKSVQPWDKAKGTITVNYTLGGVDAATDYKVAFDITAGGQIASVTNDAAKLTDGAATKEINTVEIFGKQVVDTKAKVKVSLIAIKPKAKGGFQLWEGGPIWAETNLGDAEQGVPAEYGALYKFDNATNEVAKLGDGWRLPTRTEFDALISNCGKGEWTNHNGVYGCLFKGTGDYASKSIFLPAAGFGEDASHKDVGTIVHCWTSSQWKSDDTLNSKHLYLKLNEYATYANPRNGGRPVRAVRSAD